MVASQTMGELQLTTEVNTAWASMNFSPNRMLASFTVSAARSGVVTMPMNGLSEYFMWE